jgi:hypothetical protein
LRAPARNQQAQPAARQRQQHALDQRLAEQAPRVRAQRGPDRKLARPADRTREQQVADVHARYEQHEPDRAQQQQQRQPDLANHLLLERHEARAVASIGVGIGGGQIPHHPVEIGLRLP